MLQFFRVNAFYQIFSLVFLLILIRFPAFLNDLPLLIPEMRWQLIGEQIASGSLLYVDILDNIGPFSGFVYGIIHFFVGRSVNAYHIIALIITTFQIFYFTLLVHKKGLFRERNYVPGLIILLFFSLSFDFYTLSPALMANTFLMLAFGSFLGQIERHGATDEVFEIGVLLGIAFLFYPPLFVFFLWILVGLSLFTGAKIRQQFLVLFGVIFPFLIVAIWYFIDGHFNEFYNYFLLPIFEKRQFILNDFKGLLISFALPLLVGVLGFFKVIGSVKFNNFQTRAQQIVLLWFVAATLSIILMPFLAPMQFIPFLLPLAYFNVLYFADFKKKWIAELLFLGLFLGVIFVNFQAYVPSFKAVNLPKLDKLRLLKKSISSEIEGKKVLVLGNDLSPYIKNKTATPYINWDLSKAEFINMNNYNNVIRIMLNFEKDKPQYIFDQENLMEKVFQRIPALGIQYVKITDGLYKLKNT